MEYCLVVYVQLNYQGRRKRELEEDSTNPGNISEEDDYIKGGEDEHQQGTRKPKIQEDGSIQNCDMEHVDKKKTKLSEPFSNISFPLQEEKSNFEYQYTGPNKLFPKCGEAQNFQTSSSMRFMPKGLTEEPNPYQAYSQLPTKPMYLPPRKPSNPLHPHSQPTATITSSQYQKEQQYLATALPVKSEPSPLDNAVYEGSITDTGLIIHNSRADSQHTTHQGAHNTTGYTERQPYAGGATMVQRPSVIKNASSLRSREHKFLQMEAKMLKMHGNLLTHTGIFAKLRPNLS